MCLASPRHDGGPGSRAVPVVQGLLGVSRPVGRVLCPRLRGATVIHLGLPLPAASCGLPASIGRSRPQTLAQGTMWFPSWPCSGWGLPSRRSHLRRWWSLTPPFHPYPRAGAGAVCFLWHYPAGHPGSALPTTLPCGARTFLTGARPRRDRPADSPTAQDTLLWPPHSSRSSAIGYTVALVHLAVVDRRDLSLVCGALVCGMIAVFASTVATSRSPRTRRSS